MLQRKLWAIILIVFAGFIGLLMLANPFGGHAFAQDSNTGLCLVADTGLVQTVDADVQTFTWGLPSPPVAVNIIVCDNVYGSHCVSTASGISFAWYTAGGADVEYGIRVHDLSATSITMSYANSKKIAYHLSLGWLQRGSAYIRIMAYDSCNFIVSIPTATVNATIRALVTKVATLSTPNATIPPLVTAIATLSTPAPTDTPNATIEALVTAIASFTSTGTVTPTSTITPSNIYYLPVVVTDTLSSGNEWMFVRSLTAGDVAIGAALLCLLAVGAFKLVISL